ncbi:2946_t:CDS:2 [Cetraspora pellucida]|uniref:2946_t:CDS:1 n=1 Tax=Cetraspora pellucida TaxID=1433469 RepID=A0A9N9J0G8_9GLOM|nr:2946_t:CDS:2 [Cetraspora pellucida]
MSYYFILPGVDSLAFFKQQDMQHFGKLLEDKDESDLSVDELKERIIMRLFLKIKSGISPLRKTALRHITDKILPLLMSQNLED